MLNADCYELFIYWLEMFSWKIVAGESQNESNLIEVLFKQFIYIRIHVRLNRFGVLGVHSEQSLCFIWLIVIFRW